MRRLDARLMASRAWPSKAVSSDRSKTRPEFDFSHRNILRTKVNVPASLAGRSFMLDFQYQWWKTP